jgi:hypothetical protein
VLLRQGDAAVFAVNHRPVRSMRGFYRANLRHGVSKLHRGQRHTLGVIFHDSTAELSPLNYRRFRTTGQSDFDRLSSARTVR